MEQLVWAIIFIVFIIITALKNRGRYKKEPPTESTTDSRSETIEKEEKIVRYLEGIFGVERPIPRRRPEIETEAEQIIGVRREKPKPEKKRKIPKPEIQAGKVGEFTSPLIEKYAKEETPVDAKKKDIYLSRLPWSILTKKDLKSAIILSEIIGPPIAKRKGHRLV